jgi:hypothetical protein
MAVVVAMIFGMLLVPELVGDLAASASTRFCGRSNFTMLVQLIQQRALQDGAGGALVFGFQTLGDLAISARPGLRRRTSWPVRR